MNQKREKPKNIEKAQENFIKLDLKKKKHMLSRTVCTWQDILEAGFYEYYVEIKKINTFG